MQHGVSGQLPSERQLAAIEASVLAPSAGAPDALDARALLFLLRRYQVNGREDLGDVIGRSLAAALADDHRGAAVIDRAEWLELFIEASALSEDERFGAAIAALVAGLRGDWRAPIVEEAAAALGACLRAALVGFDALASGAIDQLEQIVSTLYRPGSVGGTAADQVRTASTLLTAYSLCGRLPYPMLAEELMQHMLRLSAADELAFVGACEGVRVLARLAALHANADYRAAAVIAPGVDYRRDAQRLLAAHADEARRRGAGAAIYGVALLELESADPGSI